MAANTADESRALADKAIAGDPEAKAQFQLELENGRVDPRHMTRTRKRALRKLGFVIPDDPASGGTTEGEETDTRSEADASEDMNIDPVAGTSTGSAQQIPVIPAAPLFIPISTGAVANPIIRPTPPAWATGAVAGGSGTPAAGESGTPNARAGQRRTANEANLSPNTDGQRRAVENPPQGGVGAAPPLDPTEVEKNREQGFRDDFDWTGTPEHLRYRRGMAEKRKGLHDNMYRVKAWVGHLFAMKMNSGIIREAMMDDPMVIGQVGLACFGEALAEGSAPSAEMYALALTACNLFVPTMDLYAAPEAIAREIFVRNVRDLWTRITRCTWVASNADEYRHAVGVGGFLHGRANLPEAWGQACGDIDLDTAHASLDWLTGNYPEGVSHLSATGQRISFRTNYTMYIAFARRGQLSEGKLDRVIHDIKEETNVDLNLTTEGLLFFYKVAREKVKPHDLVAYFRGWADEMQGRSLRLKAILDQIPGTGMTAINTIRNAMLIYPDFPWNQVMALFPGEMEAVDEAYIAIGQDPYYGFLDDLGPAKSTRYKNVAWLAKELLIKKGAEGANFLKNYGGWIKHPARKDQLMGLIEMYEGDTAVAVTPADNQGALRILEHSRLAPQM